MKILRYGNTNTFYVSSEKAGLLIDTDYAGTLPAFYKAIKREDITLNDIRYVFATHYHPDHTGLIGQLTDNGIKLLLLDVQKDYIHFSDRIFERDNLPYIPIDTSDATVITCEKSRELLRSLGIKGEIIHTPSHSDDSVTLITDNGECFVGDTEPPEYACGYGENSSLKRDWDKILSFAPKRVFYSHRPEQIL